MYRPLPHLSVTEITLIFNDKVTHRMIYFEELIFSISTGWGISGGLMEGGVKPPPNNGIHTKSAKMKHPMKNIDDVSLSKSKE